MTVPGTVIARDGFKRAGFDKAGIKQNASAKTSLDNTTMNPHSRQSLPDAKKAMAAGIWNAHLELDIARSSRGVRLMRSDHRGPLYVQKALYPEGEDLPHLYLLHPPGGLVSGDQLDLRVNVAAQSSALVTSPGAGRLYGARVDQCSQRQTNRLELKADSSLEWFPMETLVYSGAKAETCTQVYLDEKSHFIGWDICALGLPSSAAPFSQGSLRQTFEIYRKDKPEIIERLAFKANDERYRDSPAGLAGFSCNALFVAGPIQDKAVRDQIKGKLVELCRNISGRQAQISEQTMNDAVTSSEPDAKSSSVVPISGNPPMMGITQQGNWLVVRYLGDSATLAREAFVKSWCLVRPGILGREACLPRIWAC